MRVAPGRLINFFGPRERFGNRWLVVKGWFWDVGGVGGALWSDAAVAHRALKTKFVGDCALRLGRGTRWQGPKCVFATIVG